MLDFIRHLFIPDAVAAERARREAAERQEAILQKLNGGYDKDEVRQLANSVLKELADVAHR